MLSLQTPIQQHHAGPSSPTDTAHRWLTQNFSIDRFFQRGPQYHLWNVLGDPLRPINYQQALQVQSYYVDALRPFAVPFAEDVIMTLRSLSQEQSVQANEECIDLVSRLLAGAIVNSVSKGGGLYDADVSEFRGSVGVLCSYLQKRWAHGHHHLVQQQQQQHRQLQHHQQQHIPLFNSMHPPIQQSHQHRLPQQPLQPQNTHHSHIHQPSASHPGLWTTAQERAGHGSLQDSEIEAKMFEETMSNLTWMQDIYSADDDSLAADRIWGGPVGSSFK
jgi:hypothetical protein